MSNKKQTWRLIVKKTGEVIIGSTSDLNKIQDESIKLINLEIDHNHQIHYFEDDLFIDANELIDYFNIQIK